MFISKLDDMTRRAFMRRSAQLGGMGVASSYALGLAGMGEAAAFSAGSDYKALVCVFLYGGNDHANTLIPFDTANYARYSAIRGGNGEAGGGVARARAELAGTVLATPDDQVLTDDIQYALAPELPRLKRLFDAGDMAPLLNVGPLIAPLTRAQYDSSDHRRFPRPAKLFSHNDQQSTWQSAKPEGAPSGWGGRIGDLALGANTNSMFTCISATGNAVFLNGEDALAYRVAGGGAIPVENLTRRLYGSSAGSDALRQLITADSSNILQADYGRVTRRSIELEGFVNAALSGASLSVDFDSGNNRLSGELEIVARLIAARAQLGVRRQVFMVGMGGYDTHDGLIGRHGALLGQLDYALDAFQRQMAALGVADQVTTFTASDFGRTLASNGDGSDHGWGSHHFIVGGAVNGGRYYGRAPAVSVDTDDQVGRGRLLPAVAVDQMSATLANWFGVDPVELPTVAPNIARFGSADLGFMAA
ncbi:DUF1501 domain-containing protein [Alteriqipengyuania sp. WL0013]|uniref:DUF1501 domain-containing protein n=1 Tax=Alteriqipengyuania sp. WL0013 TaxID=3110773 RepID=UPI002C21401A|nr:DUF1501 domain-containing protein [Alteriqipengyuania sp. WL0013]MEB3414503.1 DUF1501 domain-containing protein [Alteriqipengyuania sp. WL0013]